MALKIIGRGGISKTTLDGEKGLMAAALRFGQNKANSISADRIIRPEEEG